MKRRTVPILLVLLAVAGLVAACSADPSPSGPTPVGYEILSLGDNGNRGDAPVTRASMSSDGNVVAFVSSATDLVAGNPGDDGPGDGGPGDDAGGTLYIRDRGAATTVRVADEVRDISQVTHDGRFVSFISTPDDSGYVYSVHDRQSGTTQTWSGHSGVSTSRVVVDPSGAVAIYGATRSLLDLSPGRCIVRQLDSGSESECPSPDGSEGHADLMGVSENARFVLYGWRDFDGPSTKVLWDRWSGTVTPIVTSLSPITSQPPVWITDDGHFAVGLTLDVADPDDPDSQLVMVTRHVDLRDGTTIDFTQHAPFAQGQGIAPEGMTQDGRKVVLHTYGLSLDPARDEVLSDTYVWDTVTGSVNRVAADPPVGMSNELTMPCSGPSILADGSGLCVIIADVFDLDDQVFDADAWLVPMP